MIPSAREVLDGWAFVARRLGLEGSANPVAVSAAVAEARELATSESDEPAALFYAFARRPKALPGGWRVMPRLLAGRQCQRLGLSLNATAQQTDMLRSKIVFGKLDFNQVREWFRSRTTPLPQSRT